MPVCRWQAANLIEAGLAADKYATITTKEVGNKLQIKVSGGMAAGLGSVGQLAPAGFGGGWPPGSQARLSACTPAAALHHSLPSVSFPYGCRTTLGCPCSGVLLPRARTPPGRRQRHLHQELPGRWPQGSLPVHPACSKGQILECRPVRHKGAWCPGLLARGPCNRARPAPAENSHLRETLYQATRAWILWACLAQGMPSPTPATHTHALPLGHVASLTPRAPAPLPPLQLALTVTQGGKVVAPGAVPAKPDAVAAQLNRALLGNAYFKGVGAFLLFATAVLKCLALGLLGSVSAAALRSEAAGRAWARLISTHPRAAADRCQLTPAAADRQAGSDPGRPHPALCCVLPQGEALASWRMAGNPSLCCAWALQHMCAQLVDGAMRLLL